MPTSFYPGRKRVTQFQMFSTPGDALFYAQSRNEQWMRRRTKKGFGTDTFVKASEINKKRKTE